VVLTMAEADEASELNLSCGDQSPALNEMVLGSLLVQLGTVEPHQLDEAIALQQKDGVRLGEAIVQLGFAAPDQVRAAVSFQRSLREHDHARQPGGTHGDGNASTPVLHESLLGEILIETKAITQEQLEHGLLTRRATGTRLGEALVQDGSCDWTAVRSAIQLQEKMREDGSGPGLSK
jgi:hypothetical protein